MTPLRRATAPIWIASLTVVLLTTAAARMTAQAPRTVQDGVFTDAQTVRGQALYAQRCAGCHGAALEGAQAPPLAGEPFVAKWRTEPLSALFVKIRHTMPPGAPAQLTDEQAVDLVAHVLKNNGFPAGRNELAAAGAATSDIGWPAPSAGAARTASAPPAGNLAQLMRGIFFPSSNLIFTVQTRDPAAPVPPPSPAAQGAGFSVFEWGMGIYTGWPVIENAAVSLADASTLMLAPGLRCENGRLAPVTEADWIRFTDQMIAVAKRTYRLAQTRSQEAVSEATGDLSDACAACHQVYRDVGGRGRGRGAGPADPSANAGRCVHR
jgi:mono/diheme cytochrome c family protein